MGRIVFRNRLDPDNLGSIPSVLTWTEKTIPTASTQPAFNSFTSLHVDSVTDEVIAWLIDQSTIGSIYSKTFFGYDVLDDVFTRRSGTPAGLTSGTDADIQPHPGDRHPVQMMAVDTLRDRWYMQGGVFANVDRDDFWYCDLTTQTWTNVGGTQPTIGRNGGMAYSPTLDLLFLTGDHAPSNIWEAWVYTAAASRSADHIAAGCTAAQVWSEITPTGMPFAEYSQFPIVFWDAVLETFLVFGVLDNGDAYGFAKVWSVDVLAQTWTDITPASMPSEVAGQSPEQAIFQITTGDFAGGYVYQQTGHESNTPGSAAFYFRPGDSALTPLTLVGTGPERLCYGVFHPSTQRIVAESYNASALIDWWQGVLS
jgi:hypothetical protein